jgi:hypothetical protein
VLNDPVKHGRHTVEELAPIVSEKVPAAQGMHVELIAAPTKEL